MANPQRLYRYRSTSDHNIAAIRESNVWFSSPASFNDPYDCGYDIALSELTIEECTTILNLATDNKLDPIMVSSMMKLPNVREALRSACLKSIERGTSGVKGVCCFSEVWDDLLMWGHYSECHKGFCLEFDTSDGNLFRNVHKVRYSQVIPQVRADAFTKFDFDQVMALLMTKAECWSYEKEWRVLHDRASVTYGYSPEVLTGIYIGAKMSEEQMLKIIALLPDKSTRIFKMKISKTHFRLEAERISV